MTCDKAGCKKPKKEGRLLCEEHSEEWNRIWKKNGNKYWDEYIAGKISLREKVEFT